MRNGCGCAGMGCGLTALAVLGVAGFLVFSLFMVTPDAPAAVARPGATVVPAPTAAAQFDEKVTTAVAKAKSAGPKQPIQLVLTEAELSARAAQAASSSDVEGVRNVAVRITEGSMVVMGRTQLAGRDVPVEAEVKLSAANNRLSVEVASLKAGGLTVPLSGPLRDALEGQVRDAIGGDLQQGVDLGIDVKSVRLSNGQLEIEGQTR